MATSTLPSVKARRRVFLPVVWALVALTVVFVFITSEWLLYADYPMYHAYRLQVIHDRGWLIPHTLASSFALLFGPLNFSSRLRRRWPQVHRWLGRTYVLAVLVGAPTGIILAWGRPGLPGTTLQATAWVVCTVAAFFCAWNRHFDEHRKWMVRSYAVTFTFASSRVLNLSPRYWSHLGDVYSALGVTAVTLLSLLIVDIGMSWHEITTHAHKE